MPGFARRGGGGGSGGVGVDRGEGELLAPEEPLEPLEDPPEPPEPDEDPPDDGLAEDTWDAWEAWFREAPLECERCEECERCDRCPIAIGSAASTGASSKVGDGSISSDFWTMATASGTSRPDAAALPRAEMSAAANVLSLLDATAHSPVVDASGRGRESEVMGAMPRLRRSSDDAKKPPHRPLAEQPSHSSK